jgi:hypothetical protein
MENTNLTEIKNHSESICFNCIHLKEDCSLAYKIIEKSTIRRKYSINYRVIKCSNKRGKNDEFKSLRNN